MKIGRKLRVEQSPTVVDSKEQNPLEFWILVAFAHGHHYQKISIKSKIDTGQSSSESVQHNNENVSTNYGESTTLEEKIK